MTDDNYNVEFEDMPEKINTAQAAEILNVKSTQGVLWILDKWLPKQKDAPVVNVEYFEIAKKQYRQLNKSEIIELRRYRDITG